MLELHKTQKEVVNSKARFRVVCCGRRWGKTTMAVYEMIGKAMSKGGTMVAYISPTFQQSRDICWNELKRLVEPVAFKVNESRLEVSLYAKDGGISTIMLRGWESVETLRGQKFHFIVIDEVASMRNWNTHWQEVIRPTLTDYRGEAIFISTPKGFNSFYDLYNQQNKDTDYKSFHFTTYDNDHIPKDEVDKAKLELTEDRFAQEYLADFRKTEGLVYKDFNRDTHVFSEMPPHVQVVDVLAGIDWGWTNPASSHKVYKSSDRHYWVMEEFYKASKTTGEIIEHVKTYGATKIYADPAEPDRIEEARRAGLNIRDVSKDIESGISCLQDVIRQGRLHVHSSCANMIWEFETYSYPEKKPDKNDAELPIKENDHCFVGDTKIDTPVGKVNIRDIKQGDYVLTSNGYKKVLLKHNNGIQSVNRYWLQFDTEVIELVCTNNHKIKTSLGWTEISKLKSGQVVYLNNPLPGRSTDCTEEKGTFLRAIRGCMSRFGSTTTLQKFQRVSTYIIRTAILTIIGTRIYSLLKPKSTLECMALDDSKITSHGLNRSNQKGQSQPKNGTHQKRARSGIQTTERNHGLTDPMYPNCVNSADQSTKQDILKSPDSVIRTARLRRLDIGESWQEEVFDLTVEDVHEYIANGVLVHNCMDEIRYVIYMQEGKNGLQQAHVHYAASAQPTHVMPNVSERPRYATTYVPKL